ncbi:uncharacterized protein LOC121369139 [Gigantopelta aegis]|uniref:uncharacterized protein LOC121369139 n=1 Tax=Gigantopelta aegis TaxID=1735272 RepID=UPI001B88E62B|nr:uncharacterized protein LOC121369139 [Gigantopelta aegis]
MENRCSSDRSAPPLKYKNSGSDVNLSSLQFFDLKFSDLSSSDSYSFFRHGFIDEDDFEEFKQELRDFKRLQREINEDLQLQSQARKKRHRRFHIGILEQQEQQQQRCQRSVCENSFLYDPPMELFGGDEHYEEFERVFDTISSRKRFSTDVDEYSRYRMQQRSPSVESDGSRIKDPSPFRFSYGSRHRLDFADIDDSFMDFFNNDEDFMEFEKEFEKFKPRRRSHVLDDDLPSFGSSCDIFEDVQMFCDRSLNNDSNSGASENCNRVPDGEGDFQMWNSAEEWDFVLNKLKRNSRLFSEKNPVSDECKNQHRKTHVDSSNVCSSNRSSGCDIDDNEDCHYTCHHKCLHSVELDCASVCAQNTTTDTEQSPATTPKNSPSRELQSETMTPVSLDISPEKAINSSCNCSSELPVPVVVEDLVGDDRADNTNEKDETDSGYRSGTIPDEHLPKAKGQATLNREDMKKTIDEYNKHFPGSSFELEEKGETFHGFLKVTLNLVRPITMSLGARPPSIYELLTKEHIVEQNTMQVAFYMPRDTVKSIHVSSTTTTKEVITSLLKKFHILDHPRKFAMYEQEFNKTKLTRLRRVTDKECPLVVVLGWKPTETSRFRLVLQENETGEIVWDGFSCVELSNFLKVLDREEEECTAQLQYKYKVMKRIISQRLKEIRKERKKALEDSPTK